MAISFHRRALPVVVASVTWAVAQRGEGQAARAPGLHWSRGPGAASCIDPVTLAERVEQLTGPALRAPGEAARSIEGHIEALPQGGYRARLTVSARGEAPQGERTVEQAGSDCRALDAALAFVVAVMIDPELQLDSLPPALLPLVMSETPADEQLKAELEASPPRPAPPPASVAAPTKDAPAPEERAPHAARPRVREVSLLGLVALEVAPEPLYGGSLRFGVELSPRWSAVAELRGASGAGAIPLDDDAAHWVRAQAFDGALGVCLGTDADAMLRLRTCLGPEYSLWRQSGVSFARNGRALLSGLGVALGLELRVRVRAGFGVQLLGAARVNTLERRFVFDTHGTGYAVPRLSFLASLGPAYAF